MNLARHPDFPEFEDLLGALREGRITDAQHARLEALLNAHADFRRRYIECQLLSAALRKVELSAFVPLEHARTRPALERWRRVATLSAAAAILLIAALLALPAHSPTHVAVEAQFVAALTAGSDLQWDNGASYRVGENLRAGRCRLAGGLAQITFQSGATALLRGPADLDLIASDRAFLYEGQVVVRVPQTSGGFRLETPTARLLDIGTEFGVSVHADGGSLLQVYEGEVLAKLKSDAASGGEQRIEGGQAVGIEKSFQRISFWPERFIRTLPDKEDPAGRGFNPYNNARYTELHVVPAKNIRIDGDLGDWDLSGKIVVECVPPYGQHYYLEGAMMYDAEALYIGAHVGDPFPMRSQISPHVKRDLYGMGGGIALRLSTDRARGWPLTAESKFAKPHEPLDAGDTSNKLNFLMLWHYQPENLACLQIRYGMDLHDAKVNPPGYEGRFRMDADGKGYVMEYRIPWALLNAADDPPRGGDTLAGMFLVHWSDTRGETWRGQIYDVMTPGQSGWNFDRAATWGKLIYHSGGNLPPGTNKPLENPLPPPENPAKPDGK